MEDKKYILRQQTMRRYILAMTLRGVVGLFTKAQCRKRGLILLLAITLAVGFLAYSTHDSPLWKLAPSLMSGSWIFTWILLCLTALPVCGYIHGSWMMYNDFTRGGIINFVGEAPLLVDYKKNCDGTIELTFEIKGFPLARWEEQQSTIETLLNVYVLDMKQGANHRQYILQVVPASAAFKNILYWQEDVLSPSQSVLKLGVNAAGIPVSIDLEKVPHWLVGAATGCGKTQLLLLILHQLRLLDCIIYLADYKGVDYPAEYQKEGYYAENNADLLAILQTITRKLYDRRSQLAASGCRNIATYNSSHPDHKMPRIVIILDETSMILDSTGREKEEKVQIAVITAALLTVGRLGRAMGIHLILATQRPDVGSVPGALKAQLDGRICGHCADVQSSIVILDDGSGAKLPSIPGRFIVRDGSGCDRIIQAYFLDPENN